MCLTDKQPAQNAPHPKRDSIVSRGRFVRHYLLAVAALVGCLSFAQAQIKPTFTKHTYASRVGNGTPNGVAADLNGDGVPDLVLCCGAANNAWYQLAGHAGAFSAPVTIGPAETFGKMIATGDFNRDGNVDVVVIDATNSITVYYNQGGGVFAPTTYFPGANALNVVVADFNHDGHLDIAYTQNAVSPVQVFVALGDGHQGFSSPVPVYTLDTDTLAFNMVTGDFDGDRNPDIAFIITPCFRGGCNPSTVYALFGDGTGQFAAQSYQQNSQLQMVAADVNQDGLTDLAVVSFCSVTVCPQSVGALFGRHNRTFVLALTPAESADINYLAVADLNGDGKSDLIDSYGSLVTLGAYLALATSPNSWKAQMKVPLSNSGGTSQLLLAADFNGDQKPDIVVYQAGSCLLQERLNTTTGR